MPTVDHVFLRPSVEVLLSTHRVHSASRRPNTSWFQRPVTLAGALLAVLAIAVFLGRSLSSGAPVAGATPGGNLLVLAAPAFLAGMLSFLSPCCLPILPTYFALTFQARREQVVQTTVAFFLGLATTMVILGATATAVSQLLFQNLRVLTVAGGVVIIGFGIMSLLGKGFSGVRLLDRPTATVAGSYVYGATFALGWTACVGPILGALLTLLAASGGAVLEGAVLAFIYALGLGAPLIVSASIFARQGRDGRLWRLMRGRGYTLQLAGRTLYLHTTSIASGVLLILTGTLLATGQLALFSRWAVQSPLTQWVLSLEDRLRQFFLGS